MSSTGAEAKLIQSRAAQSESFSSVSLGQTAHSVEFTETITETITESSSVSWSTVEISSMEMSSESSFQVKLSASPKLLVEMSDVRVKSGEMADFSCVFDGQPFTGVVWDHDGQSLVHTERVRSSQSGGFLSLVIQDVGVADQGTYRCTAANEHGHSSCSAQLTVEG